MMYVHMHACMDAWMDGWMDGWMDVCMYVCIHIYTAPRTCSLSSHLSVVMASAAGSLEKQGRRFEAV